MEKAEFSMRFGFLFLSLLTVGLYPSTSGNISDGEATARNTRHILGWQDARKSGFDTNKLAQVDTILWRAIRDSAFPGAVLLVAKDGKIVHHKGYGRFEYGADAQKVDTSTIFDLASVTKVIGTTNACMRLIDEKKLTLRDRVVKFLPGFGRNGKNGITIYNILAHNSGLPAWKPMYQTCRNAECVLDSIYASKLVFRTGDSTLYSDLGFIILGKIIEKITATALDTYIDSIFFRPLGMKTTMYNPPADLIPEIAPTEIDTFSEKVGKTLRGRVHDENAAVMGGVSGHAGLFSTAHDLAVILEMIRNGGEYDGKRYLRRSTVSQFTRKQFPWSIRALGWDIKKPEHSWAGNLMSEKTYLHAGFTGTSVAVDPKHGVIIILLTNRVFPSRANGKIAEVRPEIHDAVMNALK